MPIPSLKAKSHANCSERYARNIEHPRYALDQLSLGMEMHVPDIVFRIGAMLLCIDSFRTIRRGLVDRKVKYTSTDLVVSLLDWVSGSDWVADRDITPVRYWVQMGTLIIGCAACLFVVIFGWWRPTS